MQDFWFKNSPFANKGFYNNSNIPENSIPSIKQAVENGCNVLISLSITKDKQIVVIDSKMATTVLSNHKKIENQKMQADDRLTLLDTDITMPLLSEVLECVAGKVGILLHISNHKLYKKILNGTMKILKDYNGKVAIIASNYKSYRYAKKLNKDVDCGIILPNDYPKIIYNAILYANINFLKLLKPDFIVCDVAKLPNKYIDYYLLSKPYTCIIAYLITNKCKEKTAIKFADNYIFDASKFDK